MLKEAWLTMNILNKFKSDMDTAVVVAADVGKGGVGAFFNDQKGQLTLNRLLGLIILILVYSALLPTIQLEINKINASIGASSATVTINALIPLFLSIAMLISILRSTQVQ